MSVEENGCGDMINMNVKQIGIGTDLLCLQTVSSFYSLVWMDADEVMMTVIKILTAYLLIIITITIVVIQFRLYYTLH